jgi:virulence-associated protein VagC
MLAQRIYMSTITAKVFKAGNSKALRLPSSLGVRARSYIVTPTPGGFLLTDPHAEARRLKALKALRGSCPDFPDTSK